MGKPDAEIEVRDPIDVAAIVCEGWGGGGREWIARLVVVAAKLRALRRIGEIVPSGERGGGSAIKNKPGDPHLSALKTVESDLGFLFLVRI